MDVWRQVQLALSPWDGTGSIRAELGLDSCLIMLLRATGPLLGHPKSREEKTHEASDQDRYPDVWTSGHICRSRRSAGPHPGRRPDSLVPTIKQMRASTARANDEIEVKPV